MAVRLHTGMIRNGVEPPPESVIIFALHIILNVVSIVFFSLILAAILGSMQQTIVVLVMFALIRFISGGYHLPSNMICIVVSTILIAVIPQIHLASMWTYIFTGFALIMMSLYAPSNYDRYARISEKYYPLMKFLACAIVALNFLISSEILAIIFTVQSFLLLFKTKEGNE